MYAPVGYVITGNLNIIEDRPLRMLLKRGPRFREQNNMNWIVNRRICKEAVRKYKESWAKNESVDTRVLDDWEHTVLERIDDRIFEKEVYK